MEKNAVKISQLKEGRLTKQQEKYFRLTDLRKLFGYKFTKAYLELQEQLSRFWNEQISETDKTEPTIEELN